MRVVAEQCPEHADWTIRQVGQARLAGYVDVLGWCHIVEHGTAPLPYGEPCTVDRSRIRGSGRDGRVGGHSRQLGGQPL
jgi:hypothetical protein